MEALVGTGVQAGAEIKAEEIAGIKLEIPLLLIKTLPKLQQIQETAI